MAGTGGILAILMAGAFFSQGEAPWHKRFARWSIPLATLFSVAYEVRLRSPEKIGESSWLMVAVPIVFLIGLFWINGPGSGRRNTDTHIVLAFIVIGLGLATAGTALFLFGGQ